MNPAIRISSSFVPVCLPIRGFILMLLAAFVSTAVYAQTAGTISGYVRDQSDAIVPGATVTATSQEQQFKRSAPADQTGFYNLLALPRGTYTITAEMAGFERQSQSNVELTAGQNVRLDFVLKVGGVQAEVTVEGRAPMVETKSATQSNLVDDRRVQDLPLNGRNVISLARAMPGILNIRASQDLDHSRSGPLMSVNGSNVNQNLFTFNGANFTNYAQTTGFNPPPPDAVQEIRIQTHNFTAEYGQTAGSQVSIVSRSGTNVFHGTLWEFHRDDKLNARSFFQTRRPGQRQNQAGASAGGPVLKNKLFAFGYYQQLWNRQEAGSSQAFVPTDAQRDGDFTTTKAKLTNPVDPITGAPYADAAGRVCLAGNVINPNCISPVAKNYLKQFIPTSASGVVVNLSPAPRNGASWMTRVDYNFTASNQLNFHFFRDHSDSTSWPGTIRYVQQKAYTNVNHLGLSDTHAFSPSFLNEATFSYINSDALRVQVRPLPPRDMGINVDPDPLGMSIGVSVSGRFSLSPPSTQVNKYTSWQIRDTMTKVSGSHTFKWGYEMIRPYFHLVFSTDRSAAFSGTRTGDPTADFMLGSFDKVAVGFGIADHDPLMTKHMFFFADTYKVHPRFTLDWGLRYEPYPSWEQKTGHHISWNPGAQSTVKPDAPPGILFPGDPGLPENLVFGDYNNFAPRLGFAWDLSGNAQTVIRGGYGVFYQQISGDTVHAAEAPWKGSVPLFEGRIEDPFGSLNVAPPPSQVPLPGDFGCLKTAAFPGLTCPLYPLPLQMVATDPHLRTPYIQSYGLSIQRQLSPNLVAEVSYVGKTAIKLVGHVPFNPARYIDSPITGKPPSAQNIQDRVIYYPGIISSQGRLLTNDFRSSYNSLQVQLNRRFSRGLSFSGSYVLGKNIDMLGDVNEGLISSVPNPFNLRALKGRSLLDRRHTVAASWVWSPGVKFSNPALTALLGDWTITGLHQIQSGSALTFSMGTDIALDGTTGANSQLAQLAPGITGADISLEHSSRNDFIAKFFNTAAFVPISSLPRGIYGNAGRGLISGPAYVNSDFSAMKNIKLPGLERFRLQLRGEFFNAFNQVNFSNPATTVASGSFGRITGAGDGRVVQVALKLLW